MMKNSELDFESMDFKQLIEVINDQYSKCKGKYNRLSTEWGVFSTKMNVVLRRRMSAIDKMDPDKDRFLWLHAYWICRSKLLDLHLKNKIVTQGKIKKLVKELKDYKKFILSEKKPPKASEFDLVQKLLKKD